MTVNKIPSKYIRLLFITELGPTSHIDIVRFMCFNGSYDYIHTWVKTKGN